MRAASILFALCLAIGCTTHSTEAVIPAAPAESFAGAWESVTPSFQFIRLSVVSKSSEMGVLAARITFSGVAWEGQGRIDRDSLVAAMTVAGSAQPTGVIVARARNATTLQVQVRPAGASPIELTLIRGAP